MTRLRKNSFATLGALAFTAAIALPALAASNDATTPTAPATAQEAPASPGMMQRNMQNMMMQQNIMQQNMMMQQMRQMMRQMHKMMKSMGQKHGAMGKAQGGAMKQGMNKHGAGMTSGNQPSEDCPGMATTPGAKSTGDGSGSEPSKLRPRSISQRRRKKRPAGRSAGRDGARAGVARESDNRNYAMY